MLRRAAGVCKLSLGLHVYGGGVWGWDCRVTGCSEGCDLREQLLVCLFRTFLLDRNAFGHSWVSHLYP